MAEPLTVDEIVENVRRLSTRDRLKVIERIAVDAQEDLTEPSKTRTIR